MTKFREQDSPEEVAEARKKLAEEGQGSIFESIPEVTAKAEEIVPQRNMVITHHGTGKKYTEVRLVI